MCPRCLLYPLCPPLLLLLKFSLFLYISLDNFKIHLCLFYRPPSSTQFICDTLFSYLESIGACYFSDFNINYDNPSHPMFSNLCTISSLYCLTQVVTGPTHVHHDDSKSTIDLVFVSEPSSLNRCDTVAPLSNSDHWGILIDFSKKQDKPDKSQGRLIWRYKYADWIKACELIDEFNWDSISTDDIELSWKLWHQQFMSIMNQTIPNRIIPTRRNLPWLNKSIVKLMRKRNQLFKKAKKTGDFSHYRLARNRTLAQLRLAKKKYFHSLNPKDPKKFWKAIKYLNKSKKSIPSLTIDTLGLGESQPVECVFLFLLQ